MKLEAEASKYLKERKEYKRVIDKIYINYKKLGKLSGTINLENLTTDECKILSSMDYRFHNANKAKFTVKKFVDDFCMGKFEDIDFLEVLKIYMGKELLTNKEKKDIIEKERKYFFKEIFKNFAGTDGAKWLEFALKNKTSGYIALTTNYKKSLEDGELKEYKKDIETVINGVNSLSYNIKKGESIPMFSSKISKDPHFFDLDELGGKLLLNSITFKLNKEYADNVEGQAELLYEAGLLKDEISSNTVTYGLRAYKDNEEIEYIYDFTKNNQPLTLTLGNISNIDYFKCNNNKLFLFENPSVFISIIKELGYINPTIICTSGQLNLSSLILLDKTIENIDEVYYSGDFDPEGIVIADKLKQRYGNKLKLWRFTENDYENTKSRKQISEKSISKLLNIKSIELKELSQKLIKAKLSGYQELLVDDYIKDILDFMIKEVK